jgi:O-antigen ligase
MSKQNFRAIIIIFGIFAQYIFFGISSLIGYTYEGNENSSAYVFYLCIIMAFTFSQYCMSFKVKGLTRSELFLYSILIYFAFNHGIWAAIDPINTPLVPQNLLLFGLFGLSALFAARTVVAFNLMQNVIKIFEIFIILVAIGVVFSILLPFFNGIRIRGIAGHSYQFQSYLSTLTFGMLSFYTFRVSHDYQFKILSTPSIKAMKLILMLFMVFSSILSGGRGGFVLLVLYLVLTFLWNANVSRVTVRAVTFSVTRIAIGIFIVVGVALTLENNDLLAEGLSRATAFIGDGDSLTNLEGGSSGRDIVYSRGLNYILEEPIIGYGAFAHSLKTLQPHNFFIDIALQFGIPMLLVAILFLIVLFFRFFTISYQHTPWIVVAMAYPVVFLMFSSTYLQNSIFWFIVSFMIFQHPIGGNRQTTR